MRLCCFPGDAGRSLSFPTEVGVVSRNYNTLVINAF